MTMFTSGGETVDLTCESSWLAGALAAAAPVGAQSPGVRPGEATIAVRVEASRRAFRLQGADVLTRGASCDGRRLLIQDAGGSGFDLLVTPPDPASGAPARVVARYRPARQTLAANLLLRSRFTLLAQQVLVIYPILWVASLRGRVPLHASAFEPATGRRVLLAGPGGVGKSTVLVAEVAAGGRATSDNLCVWGDGTAFGVVEPLRIEGEGGRRTTHGRRERDLTSRTPNVRPEVVVVLRRGPERFVRPLAADRAADALVAGTYSAGELRRYWGFAAVLALGSGLRPAHPDVRGAAADLCAGLPCLEVCLGELDPEGGVPTLSSLMSGAPIEGLQEVS